MYLTDEQIMLLEQLTYLTDDQKRSGFVQSGYAQDGPPDPTEDRRGYLY